MLSRNEWAGRMKTLIAASQIPSAAPAAPMIYDNVNDLPIAVRRTLLRLHRSGMSSLQIAAQLSLPLQWVLLFVETPPGASHH